MATNPFAQQGAENVSTQLLTPEEIQNRVVVDSAIRNYYTSVPNIINKIKAKFLEQCSDIPEINNITDSDFKKLLLETVKYLKKLYPQNNSVKQKIVFENGMVISYKDFFKNFSSYVITNTIDLTVTNSKLKYIHLLTKCIKENNYPSNDEDGWAILYIQYFIALKHGILTQDEFDTYTNGLSDTQTHQKVQKEVLLIERYGLNITSIFPLRINNATENTVQNIKPWELYRFDDKYRYIYLECKEPSVLAVDNATIHFDNNFLKPYMYFISEFSKNKKLVPTKPSSDNIDIDRSDFPEWFDELNNYKYSLDTSGYWRDRSHAGKLITVNENKLDCLNIYLNNPQRNSRKSFSFIDTWSFDSTCIDYQSEYYNLCKIVDNLNQTHLLISNEINNWIKNYNLDDDIKKFVTSGDIDITNCLLYPQEMLNQFAIDRDYYSIEYGEEYKSLWVKDLENSKSVLEDQNLNIRDKSIFIAPDPRTTEV